MKKCTKCNKEKELIEFSIDKHNKNGLCSGCKSCGKEYRKANKERIKEQKKEYYKANKEHKKQYRKEYYQANKEQVKEQVKEYRKDNREKLNKYGLEYEKRERLKNPLFKMKKNLRTRTWAAFRNKGYDKNNKTQEILGADWEVCKAHIERQFKERMNWGNQGEWHIDHIIPLSSVNTQKELTTLCNYQNLQPLWAKDNIEKSAKYNEIDKVNMIKKIKDSLIQKVSQVIEK
jgi:hypothetical protein